MNKYKESSEAIDVMLRLLSIGAITGVMLAAPNAIQILEKPLDKLFKNLDESMSD